MGVWPEPCPDCGGEGQFDESHPDALHEDMRDCGACKGTGRAHCDRCRKEEAHMRAWVREQDEAQKNEAQEIYLCGLCADALVAEGRILLIEASADGPAGVDNPIDFPAASKYFKLKMGAPDFGGGVAGTRKSAREAAEVRASLTDGPRQVSFCLTPAWAIEFGSRLVLAGRFAAQKQEGEDVVDQVLARLP